MEVSKNVFVKGINSDVEHLKQPKDTLRDVVNMDILANGKFGALSNMKGSTNLKNIVAGCDIASLNVLASSECDGTFNGATNPCIVYFTFDNTKKSQINAYDIVGDTVFNLFDGSGK